MRKKNNLQLITKIPDGEGLIALPIVFVLKPVIVGNLRLRSNTGLPLDLRPALNDMILRR